jgi:hypothetical protein
MPWNLKQFKMFPTLFLFSIQVDKDFWKYDQKKYVRPSFKTRLKIQKNWIFSKYYFF